jgi:4-hydroxy-tetrahydrodipicolinate reductase
VSAAPLRVAVAGVTGRMGSLILEQVLAAPDLQLVAALAREGSEAVGQALANGLRVAPDAPGTLANAQVLIDFTRVGASLAHLEMCRAAGCALVIGTTGFNADELARLREAAQQQAILWAPNTSLGVNTVFELLRQAGQRLGPEYDVEIVEAHHRHKVDAPSGTALQMGEVVAEARGRAFADVAVLSREGHTGAREPGSIGFATVRGGAVIGDHAVMFCGEHEVIEIAHRSSSRAHYASGALAAARFVAHQPAGFFRMADVLADLAAQRAGVR